MAQLPNSFNSSKHDDMSDFSAFEVKNAPAQIVKSSYEQTKNKDGHFLKLEFKILAGKYKGNHVWTQLNLDNKSQKAVEIANKELATICRAVGKVTINDSQELHGIPLLIDTAIESSPNYADKTKITMYKKYEGGDISPEPESGGESDDKPEEAKSGKKKPWD